MHRGISNLLALTSHWVLIRPKSQTTMKHKYFLPWILALSIGCTLSNALAQQTTAFTYQGQLRDGGTNANGAYSMVFKLYDAGTNGNQIGSAISNNPEIKALIKGRL